MQEEVENRTVNLAISTTKLTGRTIIAGIRKYLQHREKVKMKKARDPAVHGKQSVKQLLGQNQGATNVEIDKESTLICTYGDSLDGALIYLENFAPDEARERFEERIRSLFETKWIIELVDMAMLKIREYPDKGALYCEIISKAYLNRFKYRESEMLEVLNMERSTYYDRKKEAILLFGLSLWGTAIPKLKDFLESAREEEALCYCEC